MLRYLAIIPALLLANAAQAAPALRGVFVGVNEYLYSQETTGVPADISNLKGAVADVTAIKQALQIAYKVQFDAPVAGKCESTNAHSITLTDKCATRLAILKALTGQIRAAAPGDTVIFYFAGHGSTIADDQNFDQAGGFNSTILPTDARNPASSEASDILDRELRGIIDVANARGVNFVSIFDSCNSGTAVRGESGDGLSRGVEGIAGKLPPAYKSGLDASGPGGGYRVHFGAAHDSEEAREVRSANSVNGVFTAAFAQALIARPDATFGDLATAVRLKVQQRGHKSQHPQAEGELRARFGGPARRAVLFEAKSSPEGVLLAAGQLLGMTTGSKFALYDSERAALDGSAEPLARATITELSDGSAVLKPDAVPAAPLPNELIARETEHAYGPDKIKVSLSEAIAPKKSRLFKAVTALGFVEVVPDEGPAQFNLIRYSGTEEGPVILFAQDGTGLANLPEVSDNDFAGALRRALLPAYKALRLIALPGKTAGEAGIALCISTRLNHPVQTCPELADRQRSIPVNQPVILTVTNTGEAARYVYVLVIDDQYGITQLIPTHNGLDDPMPGGGIQRMPGPIKFDSTGLYRFVIMTSDVPINAATLEQAPMRRRPGGRCNAEWEDPGVCAAGNNGARDGAIPKLGTWTITVEDALVR